MAHIPNAEHSIDRAVRTLHLRAAQQGESPVAQAV